MTVACPRHNARIVAPVVPVGRHVAGHRKGENPREWNPLGSLDGITESLARQVLNAS
jgi:hypothetical protein